jgi:uncharacterized protein with FMN-binding domain
VCPHDRKRVEHLSRDREERHHERDLLIGKGYVTNVRDAGLHEPGVPTIEKRPVTMLPAPRKVHTPVIKPSSRGAILMQRSATVGASAYPNQKGYLYAMKSHTIRRAVPAALITTAAALQAGSLEPAHAASLAARSQTFKGPTVETMHGPVQVSIVVKSKKIVNVKTFISPNSDGRSPFLQERAVPLLKQETLKAQSAKIDVVSGATETSEAFITSLQSAIKKAHKANALK